MLKRIGLALAALVMIFGLGACNKADTVSHNLSQDADSFKITREIVFYNGVTGEYISEVTGRCSIGNDNTAKQMSYTCQVGPDQYIKNYLGISDNVTWFAIQVKPATSDPYHFEVIFKPQEIIPNVNVQTG